MIEHIGESLRRWGGARRRGEYSFSSNHTYSRGLTDLAPEAVKKLIRTSLTDFGFEFTAENLVERLEYRMIDTYLS